MRNSQQKRNDIVTPLEQLQQLLVPQEIFAWEEEIEKIQQNLARIEQKINDREEIKRSMEPLWQEMLSNQVAEEMKGLKKKIAMLVEARIKENLQQMKQEMSEAIAPAIGKAMSGRTRENKEEMEASIVPIVSRAISEYIKESPLEIAQAIAPEIASAVQEQNRLDRDAMVKALSPLIDEMIQNKILQDKESMSAAIAPVISPAITQQMKAAPEEVANAIAPEIATAVKKQIKLERTAMIDALYPIIGNTIGKYIGETIRDINRKIENALTLKGIERKIRAKLQGVSEAELMLAEEISFSTRAIFLIHKASGIVISEVQQPEGPRLESDLVAGMLTAIRSFVGEYFAQSGKDSEIDEINYGNDKIILEVAGSCYLAVVIEGEESKQFIQKMRQTLSEILLNYGQSIEEFKGKAETIPQQLHQQLQELVISKESKVGPQQSPVLKAIGLALAALIALPWGIHQYRNGVDRRLEAQVADALAAAPSLSVYRLDVEVNRSNLKLKGRVPSEDLRRQAEAIARAAAPTRELENQLLAVEVPPDAKQTAAELHRITLLLNQIDGIAITTNYADGQVTVTGVVANRTEAENIVQALQQIPGVKSAIIDLSLPPER
ncbi:MAG: BON domain-containing protein [Hormoscilla sp.]